MVKNPVMLIFGVCLPWYFVLTGYSAVMGFLIQEDFSDVAQTTHHACCHDDDVFVLVFWYK